MQTETMIVCRILKPKERSEFQQSIIVNETFLKKLNLGTPGRLS